MDIQKERLIPDEVVASCARITAKSSISTTVEFCVVRFVQV